MLSVGGRPHWAKVNVNHKLSLCICNRNSLKGLFTGIIALVIVSNVEAAQYNNVWPNAYKVAQFTVKRSMSDPARSTLLQPDVISYVDFCSGRKTAVPGERPSKSD